MAKAGLHAPVSEVGNPGLGAGVRRNSVVSSKSSRRYILKTPNRSVPFTGPEWIADNAIPSTVLVSRGSMSPSSRTLAVEK